MSKIFFLLLTFFILALAFANCRLEKESDIPSGESNRVDPVFSTTTLKAISHDSILAEARLSTLGNLTILRYGWVWSEDSLPVLEEDYNLALDSLGTNTFFTLIVPDLILGKTYRLRPFVTTGRDTIYGPESPYFMGIPKVNDITLLDTAACLVHVTCSLEYPTSLQLKNAGIVYSLGESKPTYDQNDDLVENVSINNFSFETNLTMLNPNTLYSLRAFAQSDSGIGYSKVLTFTTPFSSIESANFTINTDATIFQGAIVNFTNTSVGATSYLWDFGDGTTSTETSKEHTFNTLGNKTIQLIAENGGCRLTKDTILTVTSNPFENYWAFVSEGSYMMGCDTSVQDTCFQTENPVHEVFLGPFFIGKTEITQGQWLAVTGSINPSNFEQCGLDCPVENVSWNQIVDEFIPALYRKTGREHRLPTEAEWEYAARGIVNTKYAGSDDLGSVGWYNDNSDNKTHVVGEKGANGYELYDMSGNVWEWVQDHWHPNYDGAPADGTAWTDLSGTIRVLRGGSYSSDTLLCRIPSRSSLNPAQKRPDIGFRLVHTNQ